MRRAMAVLMVLGVAAGMGGCKPERGDTGTEAEKRPGKPVVYTTFYPTAYFAERIGGALVEVVNPCPPESDPATWMPSDATIAAYQEADLIVVNGASFEAWLARVSLPEARVVDTAKPLAETFIVMEHAMTHSHGPGGEHTHEGVDGHTWLDPENAKVQAGQIRDALIERLPEQKATLEANYQALAADLEALGERLHGLSERLGDRQLFAAHPAYNYLARRYGWKVHNFGLDPLAVPGEDALAEVAAVHAKSPGTIMLWEAKPLAETAELMDARFGLKNVVYAPVESLDAEDRSAGEDFMSLMGENVDRLEAALAGAEN